MTTLGKALGLATAAVFVFASPLPAAADEWWPDPANAQWQYAWRDSAYSPNATVENVGVATQSGTSFMLQWAANGFEPPSAPYGFDCAGFPDLGVMTFKHTTEGIDNTNWEACPPGPGFPVLCAVADACNNSLASTLFTVIWAARTPVLSEPVLQGTSWTSQGGATSPQPTSSSAYLGVRRVTVPAFPHGVSAAVVRSQIKQAGALGDPYGSGTRTTWWVYGVGPVKVVFDHSGRASRAVTSAQLLATNQSARAAPPDQNYFPLTVGTKATYAWTNTKPGFSRPVVERMSVDQAVNDTASLTVESVSGPIKIVSSRYIFALRLSTGLTSSYGKTTARTRVQFPTLGRGRSLLTPLDLMLLGSSPVLPAYSAAGDSWRSDGGTTRIVGIRTVHVPAGTFHALEVKSALTDRGHPFGSGVRTCWFAPGRGLVKLVFDHAGGGVSVVRLLS